ncbi:MAG: ribosome maturation protein RimP [Novosphingobium sp.]|nr:ribosome maturation protein RimP [Novosphingobium sp.]
MADLARIVEVVEPEAQALGFDLVRVKIIGSEAGEGERALQIMAEDPATGQLVIEQCAELSRRVSDRIDALEEQGEMLIEGAYRLEVSSPGIDRPLTRFKDFAAWTGHEAKVEVAEAIDGQKRFRGDLGPVDPKGEIISIIDGSGTHHFLPFGQIHSAKLVLTDRLIDATMPLDTSGADEILEEEEG